MRPDVHKIIAERPKSARTWAHKTPRANQVLQDARGDQMREDSNHIRRKRQKMRNRRFNILDRFLINSIGRHWDKVYAEVCAVADTRSLRGAELREWLRSEVATECWLEGRIVKSYCHCCGSSQVVNGLYVHPKSGVLKRTAPV